MFIACKYEVANNQFVGNYAGNYGGAIYYDKFSPSNLLENNFTNNYAKYGPNFASYAFFLSVIGDY